MCLPRLTALLQDLLNFDDPLNSAAAEHFQRDKVAMHIYAHVVWVVDSSDLLFFVKVSFSRKVQQYVRLYAS